MTTLLPDLASRALGGAVVHANDEFFAEKENLIKPGPPVHDASAFGHKGKLYDGWETRRRRTPGHDEAIVRLGVPGLVRQVSVDTRHFIGNYPPEASVEATCVDGHPGVADLRAAPWRPLVPRSRITGNAETAFPVEDSARVTHVRLSIYPDGGVARLRVLGEPVADPRLLALGAVDLAATEHGGLIADCSDAFFGDPRQLIAPGRPRRMGEGWETARRRDAGHDWIEIKLAAQGTIALAEIDTSYYIGNAPGEAALSGRDGDRDDWFELLPRTPLQPDTRHRFFLDAPRPASHVRLSVYPDGGASRLRLIGTPTAAGHAELARRWGGGG